MRESGRSGAIVTLLGDLGDRYHDTLFDAAWLAARGLDPRPQLAALRATVAAPGSSNIRA
jgi:cysteine synthase A